MRMLWTPPRSHCFPFCVFFHMKSQLLLVTYFLLTTIFSDTFPTPLTLIAIPNSKLQKPLSIPLQPQQRSPLPLSENYAKLTFRNIYCKGNFNTFLPFFFLFFPLCFVLRIWRICFRMEEIGYVMPTDIQREALPYLFSGHDCILHAQVIYILHLLVLFFLFLFGCVLILVHG